METLTHTHTKGEKPPVTLLTSGGDSISPLRIYTSSDSVYGTSQDLEVLAAPRFNWFYLLLS